MIAKAIKGRGFRGAVSYDLNAEKGYRLDSNMAGETPRQLAAEFGAVRALRPNLKKAVTHVSLAAAPGETLSDDQWRAIAQDYLDGMGYDDNQYLVTRHTDTEHDHIHIIANRIKHDGGVVSDSHDYPRQERIMREVEQRYGLQATRSSHEASHKALTKGEIEKAVRTQQEPPRQALQRLVSDAAQGNPTASQFADRLAGAGVEVRANIASTGKMNGFSFGLDGEAYSGSKLGRGFTWKALQEKGVSYEQDRDRPTLERIAARSAAAAGNPERDGITGPGGEHQPEHGRSDRPDQADAGGRREAAERGRGEAGPVREADGGGRQAIPSRQRGGDQGQPGRPQGERTAGPSAVEDRGRDGHRGDARQLAGDLRALADRHVMTPTKARQQISQAIEDSPAPAAHGNHLPPTRLQRWYGGLKKKLASAITQAREFFQERTEDSAHQAGWQADQMDEAGMEGRRVDEWRERQRQQQEQAQERERREQLERDREQAAERLSNEHHRVITPDDVAQDPRTGEWRYEPHRPPQSGPDLGPDFDLDDDPKPRGPSPG